MIIELTAESEANRAEELAAIIKEISSLHRICTSIPARFGGCSEKEHDESDPPVCWLDLEDWPCRTRQILDKHE
jgi:hypothetical protein